MAIQSIGHTPYYGKTASRGREEESGFPVNSLAGLTGAKPEEESFYERLREEAGEDALREWKAMQEKTDHNLAIVKRMETEQGSKAPYSKLAKNGIIEYNGVVFSCDDENRAITLGDVSDPDQVLTIPLEEGGCLKVNRGNLDDLARAIDMFSPRDIGRIMRAIATDAKVQKVKKEIEDTKSSAAEGSSESDWGEGSKTEAADKRRKEDGEI